MVNDPKVLARRIFERTLQAVDPRAAVERCVSVNGDSLCCGGCRYELRAFGDLRVLAVGKAAHGMLDGLLTVLPRKTRLRGVVSSPTAPSRQHPSFEYFVGGHPEPNVDSLRSGRVALELVRGSRPETLVMVLLSGGGSALMEAPLLETLSLADVR